MLCTRVSTSGVIMTAVNLPDPAGPALSMSVHFSVPLTEIHLVRRSWEAPGANWGLVTFQVCVGRNTTGWRAGKRRDSGRSWDVGGRTRTSKCNLC